MKASYAAKIEETIKRQIRAINVACNIFAVSGPGDQNFDQCMQLRQQLIQRLQQGQTGLTKEIALKYSNILINNLAFDEAALEQDLIPVNENPAPPTPQMMQMMANAMNQDIT